MSERTLRELAEAAAEYLRLEEDEFAATERHVAVSVDAVTEAIQRTNDARDHLRLLLAEILGR